MVTTKQAYPAFIKQSGKDMVVYIPDWEIFTEGKDLPDAIAMARDAIGFMWMDKIGAEPIPSSVEEAIRKTKESADDSDFQYTDGLLTFVDVDVAKYSEQLRNRAVRKNVTLPYWLNEKAEEKGINFSRVLQEALIVAVEN